MVRSILGMAAALLLAAHAHSAVLTYDIDINDLRAESDPIVGYDLPLFDGSLGTLTEIRFSLFATNTISSDVFPCPASTVGYCPVDGDLNIELVTGSAITFQRLQSDVNFTLEPGVTRDLIVEAGVMGGYDASDPFAFEYATIDFSTAPLRLKIVDALFRQRFQSSIEGVVTVDGVISYAFDAHVPVPGTAPMMGLGVACWFLTRRRNRILL
ncbi:MAG: hypothetical protein Hals2KO_26430 [Halioglobus sp.]